MCKNMDYHISKPRNRWSSTVLFSSSIWAQWCWIETELLCRVFMTSSEWIGLEIICYYCIYSTPRWAGSISPGGSVWISSTIVQYSIQLSKFCLHNVTLLCYIICTCCVTSLYFVSSAPYLPSDSWNGEIALLKFQASVPLQLFHTGGYSFQLPPMKMFMT